MKDRRVSVKCGVPQGSILGPLLFLIYINDLHQSIKKSTVHHFADDTNILHINKSYKKLCLNINHDLTCLSNWLRANKLALNVKKNRNSSISFNKKNNIKQIFYGFQAMGKLFCPICILFGKTVFFE